MTASLDGTARVWRADTGKPIGVPMQHQGKLNSALAAFSAGGRRVLSASVKGTARVWDADTGKPVTAPLHDNVRCAAFSADGRRVVTSSSDRTARVWEADTGKPIGAPLQHQGRVFSAGFSPDGRRVATASDDGTARVWMVLLGSDLTVDTALMADFAEALGGYSVNEFGSLVALDNQFERMRDLRRRLVHASDREGTLTWFLRRFLSIS